MSEENKLDRSAPADRWLALLLVLLVFAVHWGFRAPSVGFFMDSANYLSGAKSLASGQGYVMSDYVGKPKIGIYPPGWPAVLSLIWRIEPEFPRNLPLLQGFMSLVFGAASAAGFLLMRRLLVPAIAAWPAAAIWATALRSHEIGVWLMSDPLFSLLGFLFLLAWLSSADRGSLRWWWLAGIYVTFAMTLRAAGLGLALGIGLAGLVAAWRARANPRRALLILAAITVLPAAWVLSWIHLSKGAFNLAEAFGSFYPKGGFLQWYLGEKRLDLVNLAVGRLWGEMFCSLFGRMSAVAERHGHLAFLAVRIPVILLNAVATFWMVRGFWRLRHRDWAGPVLLTAAVYVLFAAASPNPESFLYRYFMPVWPLLGVAAWEGRPRLRWIRTAGIALFVLAITANLAWLPRAKRHWDTMFAMDELEAAGRWVRKNTPPDTRVAIDYATPFVHFSSWSGRPLVVDYNHPHWNLNFVGYAQQGYPLPDYCVTTDQGYLPSSPPEGSTVVFRSKAGHFVVSRLDPVREAAQRERIRNRSTSPAIDR